MRASTASICSFTSREEAEPPDSLFGEPEVAPLIMSRIATHVMCVAVNFDRDPGLAAEEIEFVRPDRMLTPKPKVAWSLP